MQWLSLLLRRPGSVWLPTLLLLRACLYVAYAAALPPQVEKILAGADRWQFDTWRLAEATQGHPLSALGFFLIQRAGLVTRFKMKPMALARCVPTDDLWLGSPLPWQAHTLLVLVRHELA